MAKRILKLLVVTLLVSPAVVMMAGPASATPLDCDVGTLIQLAGDPSTEFEEEETVAVGVTNGYTLTVDLAGMNAQHVPFPDPWFSFLKVPPEFSFLEGVANSASITLKVPAGVEIDTSGSSVTGGNGGTVAVSGDMMTITVQGPVDFGPDVPLPLISATFGMKATNAGAVTFTTEGSTIAADVVAAIAPGTTPIEAQATCSAGVPATILTVTADEAASVEGATQTQDDPTATPTPESPGASRVAQSPPATGRAESLAAARVVETPPATGRAESLAAARVVETPAATGRAESLAPARVVETPPATGRAESLATQPSAIGPVGPRTEAGSRGIRAAPFDCDVAKLIQIEGDIPIVATGPAAVSPGQTNPYKIDINIAGLIPPEFSFLEGVANSASITLKVPAGVEIDTSGSSVTGGNGGTVAVSGDMMTITVQGPVDFGPDVPLPLISATFGMKATNAGAVTFTTEGSTIAADVVAAIAPGTTPIEAQATCSAGVPATILTVTADEAASVEGATQTQDDPTATPTPETTALPQTGTDTAGLLGAGLLLLVLGMLVVAAQRRYGDAP